MKKKLTIEPGKVYVTTTGAKVKLMATGRNPDVVFMRNVETDTEFWINLDRIKGIADDAEPAVVENYQADESPKKVAKKAQEPKSKVKAEPTTKKLSALDAAAKVLDDNGGAMNCVEMIEAMATKGLWSSPKGRTPHSTLYAAILREIGTKGNDARFVKSERGKFAAK